MKTNIKLALSIFMLFFGSVTNAAKFDLTPSMDIGVKTGRFDVPGSSRPDVTATITTLNLSLAASSDKYFIVGRYEAPVSTSRDFNYGGGRVFDDSVTRTDANISFGYLLNRNLSMFAGYLIGESSLSRVDYMPNLALDEFFEYRYKESGPYIGASTSIAVGESSNLSASIAYGQLGASMELLRNGLEGSVSGLSANGYSFSVEWSSPLEGSLVYKIGYKINRYNITASVLPDTLTESFNSFTVGIAKYY